MLAVALPHAGIGKVGYVVGAALWALHDSVRPPQGDHFTLAILEVAEVYDCLLKCLNTVHELSIRLFAWSVKYISPQVLWAFRPQNDYDLHQELINLKSLFRQQYPIETGGMGH